MRNTSLAHHIVPGFIVYVKKLHLKRVMMSNQLKNG